MGRSQDLTGSVACMHCIPSELYPQNPWSLYLPLKCLLHVCAAPACSRSSYHRPTTLTPPLQDAKLQISILRALDTWLAEDHNRVEQRLTQRDAAHYLVECFKRTVHPRDEALLPQVGGCWSHGCVQPVGGAKEITVRRHIG